MTIPEFLDQLRRLDVQLRAEGDRLHVSAPRGVVTEGLREQLRVRKAEILQFLNRASAVANQQPAIVPLQPRGARPPIFAVPGHNGDVFCYRALAKRLGDDQPLFGLQPPGLDGASAPLTRVEDVAAYFARQVRAVRPDGPYMVAGFCAGGGIALELACQLQEAGEPVGKLILFGSPFPTAYRYWSKVRIALLVYARRAAVHWRTLGTGSLRDRLGYLGERLRATAPRRRVGHIEPRDPLLQARSAVESATLGALVRYTPRPFKGRLVQFLPSEAWRGIGDNWGYWKAHAGSYREFVGPESCTGDDMLQEPHVALFADALEAECRASPARAAEAMSPEVRPLTKSPLIA